ncbi:MAG: hypothetical protein HOP18_16460 [Deltaproteobacteria bacterium]|nr:hypothetical protein [Deltaproteobacteria bacterium]
MKEFFQGLVLGAVVMYGYVHQGTDFLAPFKDWYNGTTPQIENNPRKKAADKLINGFFFPRDLEREKTARG